MAKKLLLDIGVYSLSKSLVTLFARLPLYCYYYAFRKVHKSCVCCLMNYHKAFKFPCNYHLGQELDPVNLSSVDYESRDREKLREGLLLQAFFLTYRELPPYF